MLHSHNYVGSIGLMSGVPSLPTPFVKSLTEMIDYTHNYVLEPGEKIKLLFSDRSYHANARNQLAWEARGEWILMLDTDHQFEPDLLARLLHTMKTLDTSVLTGLYVKRDANQVPELYQFNKDTGWLDQIGMWDSQNTFRVDAAGGGCMLIRLPIFQIIRKEFKQQPFDIMHPYSEDIGFFLRLHKLGIDVWCNPNIECPHLQWRKLMYKDFKPEGLFVKGTVEVQGKALS